MSRRRRAASPGAAGGIVLRRVKALPMTPSDPSDPAGWGLDRAALALPANADVVTPPRRATNVRATRLDLFDSLAVRGRLGQDGLDAVRRLQADLTILHASAGGTREFTPRVDQSRTAGGLSDARLAAGARIAAALERCGEASARLIRALAEAPAIQGRASDWRAVVERESGERLADAQSAVVRTACENLAGAYRALDRERRERRERRRALEEA